jgi:hypothetical protein
MDVLDVTRGIRTDLTRYTHQADRASEMHRRQQTLIASLEQKVSGQLMGLLCVCVYTYVCRWMTTSDKLNRYNRR